MPLNSLFKPTAKQLEFFNAPENVQFKLYMGGRRNVATFHHKISKLYQEFLAAEERKKENK